MTTDYLAGIEEGILQVCRLSDSQLVLTKAFGKSLHRSIALGSYARSRATHDVDLLILLTNRAASHAYVEPLREKGSIIASDWQNESPMAQDVVARLRHPSAPGFPLDLMFPSSELHKSAIGRRRSLSLQGVQVSVSSPEDFLLLKQSAGRPRDSDDVVGIVGNANLQRELHCVLISAQRE